MSKIYDACIIGSGIIGSTVAILLSIRNLSSVVVERDTLPLRGTTLAGFGALTPFSDPFFSGETALFASKSLSGYKNYWLKMVEEISGIRIPISKSGLLQLLEEESDLEGEIARYETDCIPGYRPKVLNNAAVHEIEPCITMPIAGALYHPEPWIDLAIYSSAIERALNSSVLIDCLFGNQIKFLDDEGDYLRITLSNGQVVQSRKLVICTGLHGHKIKNLEEFPMRWVRGDGISVRTPSNKPLFNNNIYASPGFIAPRGTGEILLGSTYVDEGIPTIENSHRERSTVSFDSMVGISSAVQRISSHLGNCTVEKMWRGWRPASEDNYPIVGVLPSNPLVIYALGFLGLGVTLSLATAEAIADHVESNVDNFPKSLSPKRLSRNVNSK
jgi:glycine oxidase